MGLQVTGVSKIRLYCCPIAKLVMKPDMPYYIDGNDFDQVDVLQHARTL